MEVRYIIHIHTMSFLPVSYICTSSQTHFNIGHREIQNNLALPAVILPKLVKIQLSISLYCSNENYPIHSRKRRCYYITTSGKC